MNARQSIIHQWSPLKKMKLPIATTLDVKEKHWEIYLKNFLIFYLNFYLFIRLRMKVIDTKMVMYVLYVILSL